MSGWGNQILDHLLAENILNTVERTENVITIYNAVMTVLCVVFYILLLSGYLFFIRRKYIKKDYPLQTHENSESIKAPTTGSQKRIGGTAL